MKKLFLLSTLFWGLSVQADIGPQNKSNRLDYAGSVVSSELEQWFIMVKNSAASALSAGAIVVWDTDDDDGVSVTTSTSAGAVPACMNVSSCAVGALCKCQIYGYTDLLLFDPEGGGASGGASTAGEPIFIDESDAGYVQATVSGSIAANDYKIGVFYDSGSNTGATEAFLQLR